MLSFHKNISVWWKVLKFFLTKKPRKLSSNESGSYNFFCFKTLSCFPYVPYVPIAFICPRALYTLHFLCICVSPILTCFTCSCASTNLFRLTYSRSITWSIANELIEWVTKKVTEHVKLYLWSFGNIRSGYITVILFRISFLELLVSVEDMSVI